MTKDIDTKHLESLATTIRVLSAEAVEKANSGHPGLPMGAADFTAVLWAYFLRFDPKDPNWLGRDKFVLSAGHGSMLLYSLLNLFEYDLPIEEIQNFRQLGSHTPGHPEFGETVGVETTTGPLGQGFANGVGLALSSKMLEARYDTDLVSNRVFGLVSDGDLMEGVASEAASLAGHLGLGNLVYIYDQNMISIGGSTDISFTESVATRFESYGWHVQSVDGHDFAQVAAALDGAVSETGKPSIICARTTIGRGSPAKAGSADSHGAPLGEEELANTKKNLGWPEDKSFYVPDEVRDFTAGLVAAKRSEYQEWKSAFETWSSQNAEKAKELESQSSEGVSSELMDALIGELGMHDKAATRALSGKAIQVIAKHVPSFVGGSADLEPSNKTLINDSTDIQAGEFSGRNIRFGVREHAMGAIANGLAYTKSWIPYTGTFLVFADYMRPAIRLAALAKLRTLFIFTHDSFYVGEDGPTHQPIEHIASLRTIPNLNVFRPADGLEVACCYAEALSHAERPSTLLFTRQGVTELEREPGVKPEDIRKGGYVVSGSSETALTLIATGSEVQVAEGAAKLLAAKGVASRIVSIPCLELFLEQPESYRESVIPPSSKKVAIEAGISFGWERIAGSDGLLYGIEHFGASAPGGTLAKEFGFTPEALEKAISAWL